MKKLLCVILALPLVVFGVENAVDSADSTDLPRKGTNIKTFDSVSAKGRGKFRQKGLKTKEPDGFMLGIGNVFGGTIGIDPYDKATGQTIFGNKSYFALETSRVVPLSAVELLFGYKWFFGESGKFGMRLYGRYAFLYELIAMTNHFSVNYDLLFNFNQNQPFKFGMILGIALGGERVDYLYKYGTKESSCGLNCTEIETGYVFTLNNTYDTKFSLGVNIGFRFVIFDRSAIELVFTPQFNFRDKFVYEGIKLHEMSGISTGSEISLMGMTRFIYTF